MGKSLHVLIIEDSENDTELMLRELRRSGYQVEFERVDTAEAMRAVITKQAWDVILSDYTMPRFNVFQALEVLKASGLDIPFIIISGAIGEETAVGALKAGAYDFLVKSNMSKLGSAIEQALYGAKKRREYTRAEQAVQTGEELFGTAFRFSSIGISITSLDGRLDTVSQSLADMLGYTQAELEGKHFSEITHPEDIEIGEEAIGNMISGRISSVSFEKRYLHKTGKPIWALVSSSLLRESSGRPIHFITHILNMTERKQAEEAFRESEARYRLLFENSKDAILLSAPDGRIFAANPAACLMFGRTEEELKEVGRSGIADSTDLRWTAALEQRARTGSFRGELTFIRSDGTKFPAEVSTNLFKYKDGSAGTSLIIRDITERKQAEGAVWESEARYHRVLDAMMEGCQIIDFNWRYVYVNDVAASQGKQTREELLNHTMMEVYPGIENTELFATLRQCMEERVPRRLENQFVFPYGSNGWFELSIQPAREGIFILSTDITERKQAEQLLRKKNEELKAISQQLWQAAKLATMGELAASIAHELNNPLATISLRTEMLMAQFSAEDPHSKTLHIIESEIKRMSSLVANLLQYSRHGSSQISTIRVNEEIANTLELIQYHLRKNAILTVPELSPELPLIQADRQQLRQVFLNLFTNAADAMPLGGILTIRTWAGEKPEVGATAPLRPAVTKSLVRPMADVPQVYIEVSDTGDGIPAERLEQVWEPFYTTKPEGKGTGLGLAICRRIIQEHSGTIEILSEGIPGKGTTVRLSLPAVKES